MREEAKPFNLPVKSNWKSIVLAIIIGVGVYLLIPRLIGMEEVLRLILRAKKIYILIALICEFLSYAGAAWLLGIILGRLGYRISFIDRFRIGSIAAFATHFFPVGSFGEAAINFYFLREKKVSEGSALIMFILRLIATYTAFLILFLISLMAVPSAPHLPFSPRTGSLVLLAIVISGIIYIIYLYEHKESFWRFWNRLSNIADIFFRLIKKNKLSRERRQMVFEDIYKGIGLFSSKKRTSFWAIIAGLSYWLGDIACFFFVFLSLGYNIHWSVLIFGYGVGTLAGLISFIPGGLGVTEGALSLVYKGLGVPFSLAFTAILIFRFFSFWIWIPIGLISYLSLKKETLNG